MDCVIIDNATPQLETSQQGTVTRTSRYTLRSILRNKSTTSTTNNEKNSSTTPSETIVKAVTTNNSHQDVDAISKNNKKTILSHQESDCTIEISEDDDSSSSFFSTVVGANDDDNDDDNEVSSSLSSTKAILLSKQEYSKLLEKCRLSQVYHVKDNEIHNYMMDSLDIEKQLGIIQLEYMEVYKQCQEILKDELLLLLDVDEKTKTIVDTFMEYVVPSKKHKKVMTDMKVALEDGETLRKVLDKHEYITNMVHQRNFRLIRKVRDNRELVKVLNGTKARSKPVTIRWASSCDVKDDDEDSTRYVPNRYHKDLVWQLPIVDNDTKHLVASDDYEALVAQAKNFDEETSASNLEKELKKWRTILEDSRKKVEEEQQKLDELRSSLVIVQKVASETNMKETKLSSDLAAPKQQRRLKKLSFRRSSSKVFSLNANLKKSLQEETKRQYKQAKHQLMELLRENKIMEEKLSLLEVKSKADLDRLQSQLSIHFNKFSLNELRCSTG